MRVRIQLLFVLSFLQVFISCKDDDTIPTNAGASSGNNRELIYYSNNGVFSIDENGNNNNHILPNVSFVNALDYFEGTNKVLFLSNNGDFTKNPEIYTINLDGSDLSQVTSNTTVELYPTFSSNGSKIAYTVESANGFANIMTINLDGTNETNITNFSDSIKGLAYEPNWSLNDSTIFFAGNSTLGYGLHSIDINGNNLVKIWENDSVELFSPQISPDGSKILCAGYKDPLMPFVGDIFTIKTDGSKLVNLTNFTRTIPRNSHTVNPSWSLDGKKISFTTNRDFASSMQSPYYDTHEIYIMNNDGSNVVRITNDTLSQRYPIWK